MFALTARSTLALAVVCALNTNTQAAGFRNGYSEWRSMDEYGKAMYVQGLFDREANSHALGEEAWVTARRAGTLVCVADLHVTAPMIAGAIDKHYENYTDDWSLPPAHILISVLKSICLRHINAELAKKGLDPWSRSEGSITSSFAKP